MIQYTYIAMNPKQNKLYNHVLSHRKGNSKKGSVRCYSFTVNFIFFCKKKFIEIELDKLRNMKANALIIDIMKWCVWKSYTKWHRIIPLTSHILITFLFQILPTYNLRHCRKLVNILLFFGVFENIVDYESMDEN